MFTPAEIDAAVDTVVFDLKAKGFQWCTDSGSPDQLIRSYQPGDLVWVKGWVLLDRAAVLRPIPAGVVTVKEWTKGAAAPTPVLNTKLCKDGEPHEYKYTVPVPGEGMVSTCKHCGGNE